MPATDIQLMGLTGIHGIAADETGIVLDGLEDVTKAKNNPFINRVGNEVGGVDYNHMMEISLKGRYTLDTPWAQKVSAQLVLTNSIPITHLPTGYTAGQTRIGDVKRSRKSEGWQEIDISARLLPFYAAAA